ncbi:MAG: DUF3369 domain-containing protein [Marinagarivorans sp.]|nr:DUF3369 domain-containing protein [Marinagarivorans sp.]
MSEPASRVRHQSAMSLIILTLMITKTNGTDLNTFIYDGALRHQGYRDLKTIDMNRIGLARVLAAAPDLYRISHATLNHFFEGVLTQIVGLCNLADTSFIATIDGMVATIEGDQINVQATTGPIEDQARLSEMRKLCGEAILSGTLPKKSAKVGL